MHIFRFHIFSWAIAALLVLLPALIHKFGIAAEGNWCWIRGEELISRIAFNDLFLLLATTVFIASCILTRKVAKADVRMNCCQGGWVNCLTDKRLDG